MSGSGKSTLIKVLSGVHKASEGEYLFDGVQQNFDSPREALEMGIATVYQDLAMIPLMSIWRNFFLGSEPTKGWGPFRSYDSEFAKRTTKEEMAKMGIDIRDPDQPVGTMSGGERQSVAIARAVYFGAKVLILDEPANGLDPQGIRELRDLLRARAEMGHTIFVSSHLLTEVQHLVDDVVVINRGRLVTSGTVAELTDSSALVRTPDPGQRSAT